MLNSHRPVYWFLIVFVSFGSSPGLSAPTNSCRANGDLTECAAYVKGFLEGALLTDSAILAALESVETEHSSFFLRAYRTRLGIKSNSRVPSTFLARFCLPEATDLDKLAASLAVQLMAESSSVPPDARLYAYLQTTYPCR
jgi:hypothetical protein